MPQIPPAQIGAAFDEIATPALVIDLAAFERNLDTMADQARRLGVRLRPHGKTHKSPLIAANQIARGAVGICCQKVSEAEIFVAAGIADVLISNEVVGVAKVQRVASLARHAKIGVCADNAEAVQALAAAADKAGTVIEVLVEIDVGAGRCGVVPGPPAVALAQEIARHRSLRFAGLQSYYGTAQHRRSPQERCDAIARAADLTTETVHLLEEAGLPCRTIAGAGTGTYPLEAKSGVWNEIQPGSYIFMDADYAKNEPSPEAPAFEHALFVIATVMSLSADRAIVDAGHKALSNDSGFPAVFGRPEVPYSRPSDEHGTLSILGSSWRPNLGEKVLLIPGHCDPTVNLYDWYVGIRNLGSADAHVEALWPVAARGAVA